MFKSTISVVIPVYNHAHTIRRSLLSLASQTYRPIEVIIVNDGSTDNLLDVLEELRHHEPFRLLHGKVITQKNAGAAVARNQGFKETHGDFVIFWDADTVAHPKMLEKMLAALLVHDTADYVYCRYKFGWKTMKSQHFSPKALQEYNYIDTTSLMRREAFKGFDESLKRFQDWDLWLTMMRAGSNGIFLPEVLFRKIVHGRVGISDWIPSFVYKLPWKSKKVEKYDAARHVVFKKHGLKK